MQAQEKKELATDVLGVLVNGNGVPGAYVEEIAFIQPLGSAATTMVLSFANYPSFQAGKYALFGPSHEFFRRVGPAIHVHSEEGGVADYEYTLCLPIPPQNEKDYHILISVLKALLSSSDKKLRFQSQEEGEDDVLKKFLPAYVKYSSNPLENLLYLCYQQQRALAKVTQASEAPVVIFNDKLHLQAGLSDREAKHQDSQRNSFTPGFWSKSPPFDQKNPTASDLPPTDLALLSCARLRSAEQIEEDFRIIFSDGSGSVEEMRAYRHEIKKSTTIFKYRSRKQPYLDVLELVNKQIKQQTLISCSDKEPEETKAKGSPPKISLEAEAPISFSSSEAPRLVGKGSLSIN